MKSRLKRAKPILLGGVVGGLVCLFSLCVGCSTAHYRKSADREAYSAIAQKTGQVPGMDPKFSIVENPQPVLDELPCVTEDAEFLGEPGKDEPGARIISLEKALVLAVKNNRTYQDTKESVYLQALNLTLERYQYEPTFSARGGAKYNRSTRDIPPLAENVGSY